MKILLITGNELRHRYFAHRLAKDVNLVGVIFEQKANKHEKTDYGEKGNEVVSNHFNLRSMSEKTYFESKVSPNSIDHFESISVNTGKANSVAVFDWINSRKPDLIQLFGSSLIKDHLLEAFPDKVINLHLGLSPYYRGSGTNFWPFVHNKPECVGATIHLAVKKVDAGNILHQYRPDILEGDDIHDIGNKTIIKGAETLGFVLKKYFEGNLKPKSQKLHEGIVCYRKDLSVESIIRMYENFEKGMIKKYLDNQEKNNQAYPII